MNFNAVYSYLEMTAWLYSLSPMRNFVLGKAQKTVMQQTLGNYPAPLAMLDVYFLLLRGNIISQEK